MPTFITMQSSPMQTVKKVIQAFYFHRKLRPRYKTKASWPAFKKSSLARWEERNFVDMETYHFNIYL